MADVMTSEKVNAVGMNFSTALNMLREGLLIQRKGWNGKGMFLFIRPEWSCDRAAFEKIISVPDNAKNKIMQRIENQETDGTPPYKFTGYISMFAADGSIVNGWLASQTDILANDWQVVE